MKEIAERRVLIDRFDFAARICEGKRVLDIGGQHPMNHDVAHPFGASYRRIADKSREYAVFDRDAKPGVRFVGDLNRAEGREMLVGVLKEYRPEAILLMETLEHLNYPCDLMDRLSDYILESHAHLFVTIPNNGNWVLNALNWHQDHNVAFFRSIAKRFVGRSGLGRCKITMYPCMQRYRWYWWLAYVGAFGQPFSWGFFVESP